MKAELALVVIYGLGVYRLTRLIVKDKWISPTRQKLVRWFKKRYSIAKQRKKEAKAMLVMKIFLLSTCIFCMSVWVSLTWTARYTDWVTAVMHFWAVAAIPSIIGDLTVPDYAKVRSIDKDEARVIDEDF